MQQFEIIKEFTFESGRTLEDIQLAYQTFGELNADKSNVVWVFHAISGDTNVMDWWSGLFGSGNIYDPESHFIICVNCIGSPFGSTCPQDFDFPLFTVRDVTRLFIELAAALNIEKVHTVIGGSFGGYQALEFAYTFGGEIEHLILLASSARESAWGIAIHEAQRMALQADATFGKDHGGLDGLKAARALAMLTYRTSEILIEKQTDDKPQVDSFKASSYLNYQGRKFSEKFDPLSLYYLTKCIDSHNIGRDRGGEQRALREIQIPTLVIGFTSDLLVPIASQRFLAQHLHNATLDELESSYGHDGFLMEHEKISKSISEFYTTRAAQKNSKRVVMKFGGSSLYGTAQLEKVVSIVKSEHAQNPVALVVSARGKSTDKLIELYELAKEGRDFKTSFSEFVSYTKRDIEDVNLEQEESELLQLLEAISLLKIDTKETRDRVLAYGELISAKAISALLTNVGIKAQPIDARACLIVRKIQDDYEIDTSASRAATLESLAKIDPREIPVITGFIGSDDKGNTVTLGRNGSNYSASLIASFLQASEVQNWTDVSGIYSADPGKVSSAIKLERLSYLEANEMACFGMNLLHSKTLIPLMQSRIPLHIRSTRFSESKGTIIDQNGGAKGIKAVTSIDNVALVTIGGNTLRQNIGIDARIFTSLSNRRINVKMISQASTENGIGFVIDAKDAPLAELTLKEEFEQELLANHISSIYVNTDIAIVAIIGRHNFALEKAISTLRDNRIWMHLISNSITGKNISLVVDRDKLHKAIELVHDEVFGTAVV